MAFLLHAFSGQPSCKYVQKRCRLLLNNYPHFFPHGIHGVFVYLCPVFSKPSLLFTRIHTPYYYYYYLYLYLVLIEPYRYNSLLPAEHVLQFIGTTLTCASLKLTTGIGSSPFNLLLTKRREKLMTRYPDSLLQGSSSVKRQKVARISKKSRITPLSGDKPAVLSNGQILFYD